MINIDEIMKLIDANQSSEKQKEGIEMAKNVKCINAFILPLHVGANKNVWENCAVILSMRTDSELRPYLIDIMKWLEDLNWPGAAIIIKRLKNYQDKKWLNFCYNEVYSLAEATNNTGLMYGLKQLEIENNIIN